MNFGDAPVIDKLLFEEIEKYNLSDYKQPGQCINKASIEIIQEIFKDQENDNI